MNTTLQELTSRVAAAFEAAGYDPALGAVQTSTRPDLCPFQCNGALSGAKAYRKAPFMIADAVAEKLAADPAFEKVEVVRPGFLNLTPSDAFLLERAAQTIADPFDGVPQSENPMTIILDYGGPNVAKALHVGHLRTANIGESLKRLARACGHKPMGDIHLGDWGLQMGLVIAELSVRNPDWRCFAEDFDPEKDTVPTVDVNDLNELYPFASAKCKEDEAYKAFARETTAQFQAGRPGYRALAREIVRASVEDMKKSYARLNVDFDLWYGESDSAAWIPELMDILNAQGLLVESDGAMVVEVAQDDDKITMPPVIIRKSDGSSGYPVTDLATILQRQRDFAPDEIWYVVDKRQSLHFTQVFRCAHKAGIVPESTVLSHFGNGTMNGADGRPFKTRDGGVMSLSNLLDTATEAAAEKLRGSEHVPADELDETARRIAIAAIKFGDLMNHLSGDVTFDLDKFMSFEGKTGVYLLYTLTRIRAVLEKAGVDPDAEAVIHSIESDAQRALLYANLSVGESFRRAMEERSPNLLCDAAYQLAVAFSSFYHDSSVLGESDPVKRESLLGLCRLTRRMMCKLLDTLAIQPVDHM